MIFLTEPAERYWESFLNGLREFQAEGRLLNYDIQRIANNFEVFLQQERNQRDPRKIRPDSVPQTNFWLVDENEYIGQLSIRHQFNDFLLKVGGNIGYQIRPSRRRQGYGKEILRLGLLKAKQLDIPRALVTCDENNIGSKKVIEYNHGTFENAVNVEGSPVKKLRYWIELAPKQAG
ncbi:MAG TPA: GNAT family N-acetyltransferase [Ktedonobacteraceae bacterium]|jgi:predicted acetyltransferase|nr:GNAT family N-acetyltransferase [Ktedonobacteraceae bacterium]